MKLLILTQSVNEDDGVLGFFLGWIKEFAKHFPLTVVALGVGRHHLSDGIQVYSLGKNEGKNRLVYIFRFYRYIISLRRNYDAVFVHMNHAYVILGAPIWRLMGKRVVMWYAHGHVSLGLRIAEKFAHHIVTSTPEGFRIASSKVSVVGQGIDTHMFSGNRSSIDARAFTIIMVGRLSPVKRYEVVIHALKLLANENVRLRIVGGPILPEDRAYELTLKRLASELNLEKLVEFSGAVSHKRLPALFQDADLFINVGQTGSLDKAGLEAMASELPIIASSIAYREILKDFPEQFVAHDEPQILSERILAIIRADKDRRRTLGKNMRDIVVRHHAVGSMVERITCHLEAI